MLMYKVFAVSIFQTNFHKILLTLDYDKFEMFDFKF